MRDAGINRDRRSDRGTQAGGTIAARIWLAESPNANSFDGTVVTVRTSRGAFSFDPVPLVAGHQVSRLSLGVVIERARPPVLPYDKAGSETAWSAGAARKNLPLY